MGLRVCSRQGEQLAQRQEGIQEKNHDIFKYKEIFR